MPHGVIFDMDGVLVDSGPPHVESWRVLARQHGLEISDEDFKAHFGKTSRDIDATEEMWRFYQAHRLEDHP